MLEHLSSLGSRAHVYHCLLPAERRQVVIRAGIPDAVIDRIALGWNGQALTIPITNRAGEVVAIMEAGLNEISAEWSVDGPGSAMSELFGWDAVERQPDRIIICSNIVDRLILESHGFAAVSSTTDQFEPAWADALRGIPAVYAVLPLSAHAFVKSLRKLLPQLRVVALPQSSGSIAAYFVRLRKTRAQFEAMLRKAEAPVAPSDIRDTAHSHAWRRAGTLVKKVPLADVVGHYVALRVAGAELVAECPFHADEEESFHLDPGSQTFQCVGCDAEGDVLSFLMLKDDVTYHQAANALARIYYLTEYPDAA
jgi:hypothetical protein